MLFRFNFIIHSSLRMPKCFFPVCRSGAGAGRVEWYVVLFKGCYTSYCTSSLHMRTHLSARNLSTTSQLSFILRLLCQTQCSMHPCHAHPPSSQPCSKAAPPNSAQAPSSLARLPCQSPKSMHAPRLAKPTPSREAKATKLHQNHERPAGLQALCQQLLCMFLLHFLR